MHKIRKVFHLSLPVKHKISGMVSSPVSGQLGVIGLLLIGTGNAIIFDPCIDPYPVGMDIWLDVIKLQIKADIAVELAVTIIPRITLDRRPDLFRRLQVPGKAGHTRSLTVYRRKYPILWTRRSMKNAMGIGEEITDTRFS